MKKLSIPVLLCVWLSAVLSVHAADPAFSPYKLDTASSLCTDSSGKIILREFTDTTCSDCSTVKPYWEAMVPTYVATNKFVSRIWTVNTQSLPAEEQAIYMKYKVGVPTFVFGCKYYMTFSASQLSTWRTVTPQVLDYLATLVGGGSPVPTQPASPTSTPVPTSPSGKPGDANGDNRVDGQDYVVWLGHFGASTSAGPSGGDFNRSGRVDGQDYVVWLNGFGR